MSKSEDSLAKRGKWAVTEIDQSSHKLVRHAYEQVLNAAARLHLFSNSSAPVTDGPIGARQEMLVGEDLLSFALHARRLIENTTGFKRFNRVSVRTLRKGRPEVRFREIINMIIHHTDLTVVRTDWQLGAMSGQLRWSEMLDSSPSPIPASVLVRSDKNGPVAFELRELVEVFQKRILCPVIEIASENHLWLDEELL